MTTHDPVRAVVDLNSDLGEGFGVWRLGDDEGLLEVVTSANVACGFHAGDPSTMRRVCERAVESGVAIGAQVSYRDLAGFGRRFIDVPPPELADDMLYQIGALDAFARAAGGKVAYVKPHGALYNAIVTHEDQAGAVAKAVVDYDPALPVLGLPGSAWLRIAAEAGLPTVAESFADRAYTAESTLVSRRLPEAVLHDPGEVATRSVRMVVDGKIETVEGTSIDVSTQSICVHGDTPGALDLARRVRRALEDAGVHLASFVARAEAP